jgi:hypothetical protein
MGTRGRPALGLKMAMVRLAPDVLKRIRRIEKNVSKYVRKAVDNQLARDERKSPSPRSVR